MNKYNDTPPPRIVKEIFLTSFSLIFSYFRRFVMLEQAPKPAHAVKAFDLNGWN